MSINEITKKVNEYEQVILIGERDGQSYIHWNTKDKKELLQLLNNAIHYISCDNTQNEMAIKKLQHGFTNPTQSKTLLKLGVPTDSADCVYRGPHMPITILSPNELYSEHEKEIHNLESKRDRREGRFQTCEPCWTVGRLMEIFDTCYIEVDADAKWENYNALHKDQTYVDYIMYVFDHNYMLGKLDFSKLENTVK